MVIGKTNYVIPIDVDKSYGTMHTPDMYKRYKVISGLQMEDGGEIYYYEIEPVDLSDDDRLSGMLVGGGSRRNERLYPDHDLYKLAKEQKERKDELRRVLDHYEEDWRRISPETIIELAMMDPSPDYEYLDWMAYQVYAGFWLGVDLKYISELVQDFHYNQENLTPEIFVIPNIFLKIDF